MIIKNPQYNIGTNVSDTTATPADVLAPKEFHQADGQKVQGTIPTYAGATTITENGTVATAGKYLASDINVNIKTRIAGRPNDVVFYDYDGTELYDYSKAEFLALSAMPANPSHTGLVAEGWNWTLSDAQDYIRDYGKLNIGQFYHTESGANEFIIELTKATGLTVTENSAVMTSWGDGSPSDATGTHTYTDYGIYTVKTWDNTIGNGSNRIFTSGIILIEARLKTDVRLSYYSFNACRNLRCISRPQSIAIGHYALQNCYSLSTLICGNENYSYMDYIRGLKVVCTSKNTGLNYNQHPCFQYASALRFIALPKMTSSIAANAHNYSLEEVIIPEGITGLPEAFNECNVLKKLTIPSTVTNTNRVASSCMNLEEVELKNGVSSIGMYAFDGCYVLKRIKIPSTVTDIGNYAFSNCYALETVDFTSAIAIPTLGTNSFSNVYTVKIVVPDALYESWIVATNWASYANYIYKASEVQL